MTPAGARHSPCLSLQEYLFPCAWRPWAICPAAWAAFDANPWDCTANCRKRATALDSVAGAS